MDKPDKRGPKTSLKQYGIYVRYLKENKILRTGKMEPGMGSHEINNIYERMVKELNACGKGPMKSVESWKKSFAEWKCNVKKRAREEKELKEIEKSLINVLGSVVVTGVQAVNELGIEQQTQPVVNEEFNVIIVGQENILDEYEAQPRSIDLNEMFEESNEIVDPTKMIPPKNISNNFPLPSTSTISVHSNEDNTIKSSPRTPKRRMRGKKTRKTTDFVKSFEEQQKVLTNGLLAIASSLEAVATSINRVADVLDQKL